MYTIFVLFQNHGYSMAYRGIPLAPPMLQALSIPRQFVDANNNIYV